MDLETIKRMKNAPRLSQESGHLECKMTVKGTRKSVRLTFTGGRIEFKFGFWRSLMEEIKLMEGKGS